MTWKSGPLVKLILFVLLLTAAQARLGDTEAELAKRFSRPISITSHSIYAQGKRFVLGPTHTYKQDDWYISCDLIDGRCVRIRYSKPGDWTEDHIQVVLNSNGQGAKWDERTKPGNKSFQRQWSRSDGSTARWSRGGSMDLEWDAYTKAKATVEERAKVEAKKKPKL